MKQKPQRDGPAQRNARGENFEVRLGHPSWGKRVSEDAKEKDRVNRCTEESIEGERGAEREGEVYQECRAPPFAVFLPALPSSHQLF